VFVVCCVGRGLGEELITPWDVSIAFFVRLIVCDLEYSTMRRPGPSWAVSTTDKNLRLLFNINN